MNIDHLKILKTLNKNEREEYFVNAIKEGNNKETLVEIQKCLIKLKNKLPKTNNRLTSFIFFNYDRQVYKTSNGRRLGKEWVTTKYSKFIYNGIAVPLPDECNEYIKGDDFSVRNIWVDSTVKYGGWEYFPKKNIVEVAGHNLENLFFEHLNKNNYLIYIKESLRSNRLTYYLMPRGSFEFGYVLSNRDFRIPKHNSDVIVKINKNDVDWLITNVNIEIGDSHYLRYKYSERYRKMIDEKNNDVTLPF